jgi:hypothetical protein
MRDEGETCFIPHPCAFRYGQVRMYGVAHRAISGRRVGSHTQVVIPSLARRRALWSWMQYQMAPTWLAGFSRTRVSAGPIYYSAGARCCPTLDVAGLATFLANCSMALGRKNGRMGLPEIRVADRALTIDAKKGGPQLTCHRLSSRSNRHTHNLARVAVISQPNPFLAPLGADERPQLITLQNQAPPFCSVTLTERGTEAYLALT